MIVLAISMSSPHGIRSAESRLACAEFGNRERITKKGKKSVRATMKWLKCNPVDFDESINQTSWCLVDFLREFVSLIPLRPARPLSVAAPSLARFPRIELLAICVSRIRWFLFRFHYFGGQRLFVARFFTHRAVFYFSGLVAGEESERQKAYKLMSE